MAKNVIAAKVDSLEDPDLKEILTYIITELDRIKSLPPVTEDPKNLAIIVNKITRNL